MISIVIINYNGIKFADKLAESLNCQTMPYDEVVIVDNNSRERSAELLQSKLRNTVLIEFAHNKGFACAVNAGVKAAAGETVVLLNNDIYLDSSFIEKSAKELKKEEKLFIAPLVLDYDGKKIDSAGDCILRGFRPVKRHGGRDLFPMTKDVVSGFSMSAAVFRRRDFIGLGGLDERFFMYFEDVDFSIRASKRGYRVIFLPDCIAYHFISAGTKSSHGGVYSPRKVFREARNRVWAFFKSDMRKNPLSVALFVLGTLSSFIFHIRATGCWVEYLEGLLASMKVGRGG